MDRFYRSRDGLQLFYALYGSAGTPVVLCLPGLTRNSRDFVSLADWLRGTHCIVTPDLRGRGRSDRDPAWANYHPSTYVADVFTLLDELAVSTCAIIGTSLGGIVGMLMAAAQPQRVSGLVLNDIGPELDPRGVARIREYSGKAPTVRTWEEAVAHARRIHGHAAPEFTDADWDGFVRRGYREHADGTIRPDVDPNVARAVAQADASMLSLWPPFNGLRMPLLAIRGGMSDLLSEDTLTRMQAAQPGMQTVVVRNRGHAPTLEEPECRQAIGSFIRGPGADGPPA